MNDSSPPAPQFTVAGGLIVLTAIAVVCGVGNLWSERGGLALAIPVAAIPFSIVVELALRRSARKSNRLPNATVLYRLMAIVLLSPLPAVAAWLCMYYQRSWWAPFPFLILLSYGCLERWLAQAPCLLLGIPPLAFLILVAPSALASDDRKLPIRCITMLIIATFTSVYWFASSMASAFDHHSLQYIVGCIAVNTLAISGLWGAWLLARRSTNFVFVVAWNLVLVGWLFCWAYPWLGAYV